MTGKFFMTLLLALGVASFAPAAEYVLIGLNFHGENAGDLTLAGQPPRGVSLLDKVTFRNPILKGFCRYLKVDLAKAQSLEVQINVAGEGRLILSLTGSRWNGKLKKALPASIECTELLLNGAEVGKVPLRFSDWTRVGTSTGVELKDGGTLTLRAEFRTPDGGK